MTVPPISCPGQQRSRHRVQAVTARFAVHNVQCGWQGRDRWSAQSVKRMLMAPPIRVMLPEVMAPDT